MRKLIEDWCYYIFINNDLDWDGYYKLMKYKKLCLDANKILKLNIYETKTK